MRKILWMVVLFGAYVWAMTSGHQQLVIDQSRKVCKAFIAWFDDAEVDFQSQAKSKSKSKKRSRRWD